MGIPREQEFTSIESIFSVLEKVNPISGELIGLQGSVYLLGQKIISQIKKCQFWESIKKAGFDQFVETGLLCSKVYISKYEELLTGLFSSINFKLRHTRGISKAHSCCKVIVEPHLFS